MAWKIIGKLLWRGEEMNPPLLELQKHALVLSEDDFKILLEALEYYRALAGEHITNGQLKFVEKLGPISYEKREQAGDTSMNLWGKFVEWQILANANGYPGSAET